MDDPDTEVLCEGLGVDDVIVDTDTDTDTDTEVVCVRRGEDDVCDNASRLAEDSLNDVFVADEIGEDEDLLHRIVDNSEVGGGIEGDAVPVLELHKGMEFTSGVEFIAHVHRYGHARGHGVSIKESQRVTTGKDAAQVAEDAKISELESWFNVCNKYKDCVKIRMWCRRSGIFKSRSCDPNRSTATTKCDCPFRVNACRTGNNGTVWKVTLLKDQHNHDLYPDLSHHLPRYRKISVQDQLIANQLHKGSVGVAKMFDIFVNKYKVIESVPFTESDLRNYIYFVNRKPLKDTDFGRMEKHFHKMREQSPGFFYEYDVDDGDDTLRSVFWADSRCREAFKEFGDVVSFDTTFVTNRYKMPLAPFVGVNHHGKTMLFGCALIAKEDTESFGWIFRTFKKCMGKEPMCILTDQDRAIGAAIRNEYPETKHRWCIWHIMRNCRRHLGMRSAWGEMSKKLQKVLHDSFTIEEFESGWQAWAEHYGVASHSWVTDMYKERARWAPIFFKHTFWAGMSSTQRSEGNNHYLKCFVDINTCLADFVEKYAKAVCRRVFEEDKCSAVGNDRTSRCTSDHPFEAVFEKLFTRDKFLEFHEELKQFGKTKGTIVRVDLPIVEYDVLVKEFRAGWTKRANFRVIMDRSTLEVKCDCLNFEFCGVLCVHMLRVFWEEDIVEVPEKYVMRRWCENVPRRYLAEGYPMQAFDGALAPEVLRYREVKDIGEEIGVMVMSNEELHKSAIGRLTSLRNEMAGSIGKHEGLTSHVVGGVGSVYRSMAKATEEGSGIESESRGLEDGMGVKDPVDKRGRGRGVRKRKASVLDKLPNGRGCGRGRGRGRWSASNQGFEGSPSTPTKDVQGGSRHGWNLCDESNLLRQRFQITGGNGSIPLARKHPFGLF